MEKTMLSHILIYAGFGLTVITGFISWTQNGQDKQFVSLLPITCFVGAAAAHYMGM